MCLAGVNIVVDCCFVRERGDDEERARVSNGLLTGLITVPTSPTRICFEALKQLPFLLVMALTLQAPLQPPPASRAPLDHTLAPQVGAFEYIDSLWPLSNLGRPGQ